MKLTDVQPMEKWLELEEEIHRRSRMRASIYDIHGVGITGKSKQANDLCGEIRASGKGQTYICAVAHQNMAAMAQNTKETVIEECDAGMIKIVVPIFANGEFIGAAGGCGLLVTDGEVDDFMINKTTGIAEERVAELADSVGVMTLEAAEELARFIEEKVSGLVQDFEDRNR